MQRNAVNTNHIDPTQYNLNELDLLLDAIYARQKREFEFNETYVSKLYTLYTTHAAAKSLYNLLGLVDQKLWALRCAATFAQPLARFTGYKKTEVVVGYLAMGTALVVNTVPTAFSVVAHLLADKALKVGWENTPEWFEGSFVARELYAVTYVFKIEGIAYCAKKIDEVLDAAKAQEREAALKKAEEEAAAAQKKADEAAAAAKKAAEEAAAAQKAAEEAAANKSAAEAAAAQKKADEAAAAAIKAAEEAAAAQKAAEEAAANKSATENNNDNNAGNANANASNWPEGFGWYARKIAEFVYWFESGYTVQRMGPDNQAHGKNLTLIEAIIYFINGGCVVFTGEGKTHIYEQPYSEHPAPYASRAKGNMYVPQDWKNISITEITNRWFKKVGITAEIIATLVTDIRGYLMEQMKNALTFSAAVWVRDNTKELIKKFVKDYFVAFFTVPEATSVPPAQQPSAGSPPDSLATIAQQTSSDAMTAQQIADASARAAARAAASLAAANRAVETANANIRTAELTAKANNEFVKHVVSQFSVLSTKNSGNNTSNAKPSQQQNGNHVNSDKVNINEIQTQIETDNATIETLRRRRVARDERYATDIALLHSIKTRMQNANMQRNNRRNKPNLQTAFIELKNEITRVCALSTKVKFGLYAGQLPRNLREIQERFNQLDQPHPNPEALNKLIEAAKNARNIAQHARNYRKLLNNDGKNNAASHSRGLNHGL